MNWLLVFVIVVLAACVLNGYKKGFIKVAFSLVSMILTIVLVSLVNPYISSFVENHTPLHETIKTTCVSSIKDSFASNNIENASQEEQDEWIEKLWIPLQAKKMLQENNSKDVLDSVDFADYVGDYIAKLVVNAVSFIVTFLLITFVLRLTVFTLDSVAKLPVLNGINKIAGLAAGLAEGLIIIWIIFIVIMVLFKTDLCNYLLGEIHKNQFLSFLYNNNLILNVINMFVK